MSRDLAHRVEYYSGDMKRRLDLRKLQQPRLIGARQINSTRAPRCSRSGAASNILTFPDPCIDRPSRVHELAMGSRTNVVTGRWIVVPDCGVRPDDELIAACRAADQRAWSEVFDRYHRLVRSIAMSYGVNAHDADEIVQISFSVLFDGIDRIRPDSNLAAWLSTIARRHTWRVIEKRRRTDLRGVVPEAAMPDSPIDDHVDRDGHQALVRAALRLLPSKSRALIEALYLRGDEPSYQDVAAELGMPIGSVGPTRARCLEKLRSIVDELESERKEGMGR